MTRAASKSPAVDPILKAQADGAEAYRRMAVAWFRGVAEEDDEILEHLEVRLSARACREVADILERGIHYHACSPGDGEPREG